MLAGTRSSHNAWEFRDERFEGLLALANAINTAYDLAGGKHDVVEETELNPSVYPVWTPLRLAERMGEAATRIEEMTAR